MEFCASKSASLPSPNRCAKCSLRYDISNNSQVSTQRRMNILRRVTELHTTFSPPTILLLSQLRGDLTVVNNKKIKINKRTPSNKTKNWQSKNSYLRGINFSVMKFVDVKNDIAFRKIFGNEKNKACATMLLKRLIAWIFYIECKIK